MRTIFFLALLVFIVWFLFFRKKSRKNQKPQQQADSMIECKRCGIYVLQSETIFSNGSYFCSQECLMKE